MSGILIPHSSSAVVSRDIRSVLRVLKRNFVGNGKEAALLEHAFRSFFGRKYAVAVNSGSCALKLSLMALGLRRGSEVLTSVHVCSAVYYAIIDAGLVPRFVDVGKKSLLLDVAQAAAMIRRNKRIGAVVVPYIGGYCGDISGLLDLAVPVIEDCAASIGARGAGGAAGTLGLMSIFSFGSTKLITGGSGGILLTDSEDLYCRIAAMTDYDAPVKDNEPVLQRSNCRMNDIQAALALSQFKAMASIIRKRHAIARAYDAATRNTHVSHVAGHDATASYYRYVLLARRRDKIIAEFRNRGVDARSSVAHFMCDTKAARPGRYPNAREIERDLVSVPIYPALSKIEMRRITGMLASIDEVVK